MTAPLGEAAAQTEADLLVALLTSNPKLADGPAVFHASRGNIAEPGAPSVEALAEARLAMRTRTGLDGKTTISATPRFVVVPPDLETEAERVLATIQPTTADDVNPFGGRLSLLVEPRLPEATWYVFASPAQLAGMQYAYLSAAQGVQIQRTETWDVLGMKFRAFLDFGAGWLDWRGAQKVPWRNGELDRPVPFESLPEGAQRERVLSIEEIARLWDAEMPDHMRVFLALLLATAARPSAT